MGSLKGKRGPIRAGFTKALTDLQAEVDKDVADKNLIKEFFLRLQKKKDKLTELDTKIDQWMLENKASEEDFRIESESVTNYENQFIHIVLVVSALLEDNFETASGGSQNSRNEGKLKYRLPKLEFKKFSGEPRQ